MSSVATASVTYPYIHTGMRTTLLNQGSVANYEYGEDSPWLIQGARELLEKSFESVARNGGALYIWTKGDFHRKGYEPLPGAHEQGFRYKISGLEKLMNELRLKYKIPEDRFKFLSLPSKLRLIKEVVNVDAKEIGAEIFVIEDTIENIVEAKRLAVNGEVAFDSFLVDRGDKAGSLVDCATKVETDLGDKKAIFVYDMDDTLLHEDFRKENQPIQIYLRMKDLGII